MWVIDKTFEFCYGHRVWTQSLNGEYSADLRCACRHLHGHEGKVQVFMEGEELDHTGMVTDFRHLEWLKKFINDQIDHQFIIHKEDPLYGFLVGGIVLEDVVVPGTTHVVGKRPVVSSLDQKSPMYELYDGIMVVDFVPTSENLSKWIGEISQAKMAGLGVKISRVDWWETPKSRSSWVA